MGPDSVSIARRVDVSTWCGEDRLGLERSPRRDESHEEIVFELERPRHGVVSHYLLVIDPPEPALHDDASLVEWPIDVRRCVVEASGQRLFDKPRKVFTSFHDDPGAHLRDEDDVGMHEFDELVERALLDQLEPTTGEPLAGWDLGDHVLGDAPSMSDPR